MPTLLEQPVAIKRVPVAAREQARAVEDPTRAKVPELPYRQNMTADQMTEALKKAGRDRAFTTIRHHVRVLKDAGLIRETRIDEIRGTVSKRYGTQTRLLNHEAPEDFDAKYAKKRLDALLRANGLEPVRLCSK